MGVRNDLTNEKFEIFEKVIFFKILEIFENKCKKQCLCQIEPTFIFSNDTLIICKGIQTILY